MSKDDIKRDVIELLRQGLESNVIASKLNIQPRVVWGIKSHFSSGKYGDPPPEKKSSKQFSECASWAYLIIAGDGLVYLGATNNLKKRIQSHNSPLNTGFTKGRKWHLLAAKKFNTRRGGFKYESELKASPYKKRSWKIDSIERAKLIGRRFGYEFDPLSWLPEGA